jgi:acetyl esterase/lipase
MNEKIFRHVTTGDTVDDIINHPAFEGFGRLMLPTDDDVGRTLKISGVNAILPYHRNVDPDTVVAAINRMIDDAREGRTIFYSFYSERERQADTGKNTTGLFYFRGNPGAPFAVICPGGGFSYVGSFHEGFPYAREISKRGYNAFVIKYRVGSERKATEDLAAAISYINDNAETLGVGKSDYSVWGSSAGARMAANIGSNGVSGYGGKEISRPSSIIMAYTGHSNYTTDDPPTFAIVGDRDGIARPEVMERRINAMRNAGIDVEFHEYANVGHGFGSGVGTSAEGWINLAVRFWEKHMQ